MNEAGVVTITDIRRRNLEFLIAGFESVNAFAESIDRSMSVVYQLRHDGSFGSKMARHIESRLELPKGYLDSQREGGEISLDKLLQEVRALFGRRPELTREEISLLGSFRNVDKKGKNLLLDLADEMANKNHNRAKQSSTR
jgi:hypothetical protein